ncbi:MAG: PspC domain-containing protein [Candidatus Micrarchaeota archaeon]|nr:PspC domain-containing protein [Candidatus Micrarchaeota archaeon]
MPKKTAGRGKKAGKKAEAKVETEAEAGKKTEMKVETKSDAQKKLYRSRNEKVLGGVCGGVAEYYNSDPTLVRLAIILLTLLSMGAGILFYLIAWIIVPIYPREK